MLQLIHICAAAVGVVIILEGQVLHVRSVSDLEIKQCAVVV